MRPPRLTGDLELTQSTAMQDVLVTGAGLVSGLKAFLDGQVIGTVSDVQPKSFLWRVTLAQPGTFSLVVRNPDGKSSNPMKVVVIVVSTPTPTPPEPEPIPPPTDGTYGPRASITCPVGAVVIPAGSTSASRQTAINAAPAGQAFWLEAGTHTANGVTTPKSGQSFTGQYGAVIDGAGWADANHQHGCFAAVNLGIVGVTISNLTITNMPQNGVIVSDTAAASWVVAFCDISACAFKGVNMGQNCTVRNCTLHHNPNGNYAAFSGHNTVFDTNDISYGGSEQKISGGATNFVFRNNFVHHNDNGIWFDFAGVGILVEGNRCEDNGNDAIVIEGSPTNVITASTNIVRNNTCRRNGLHGIFVTLSHYIEVYGNTLSGNQRGIGYFVDLSVLEPGLDLAHVSSHDNDITTSGSGGSSQPWCAAFTYVGSGTIDPYLDPAVKFLTFQNNRYHVSNPASGQYWRWGTTQYAFAGWQAVPQDKTGTATT